MWPLNQLYTLYIAWSTREICFWMEGPIEHDKHKMDVWYDVKCPDEMSTIALRLGSEWVGYIIFFCFQIKSFITALSFEVYDGHWSLMAAVFHKQEYGTDRGSFLL